jgi:hypothetical protein
MFNQQELTWTMSRDNPRWVVPQVVTIRPNQVLVELFRRDAELAADLDFERLRHLLQVKIVRFITCPKPYCITAVCNALDQILARSALQALPNTVAE